MLQNVAKFKKTWCKCCKAYINVAELSKCCKFWKDLKMLQMLQCFQNVANVAKIFQKKCVANVEDPTKCCSVLKKVAECCKDF